MTESFILLCGHGGNFTHSAKFEQHLTADVPGGIQQWKLTKH